MVGDLSIYRPWSRALPPVAPNGAAYFRVENGAGEVARIVSASSPIADRVEFHTHEMDGGVMKMRRVQAVEVPAGGAVAFEPGGLHVMLIGLTKVLAAGESYPLTLEFHEVGSMEVTVHITGAGTTDHSGHGEHGNGQSR